MKAMQGDLVNLARAGFFDVIIHGCNCFNVMGRGIAKTIRETFPEAYAADCKTLRGDRSKLGTYSHAIIRCGAHHLTVVNAYTQFNYGGEKPNADYDAIRSVFRAIKRDFAGSRIGYPQIGAGLARGDWDTIAAIIREELKGEDHTVVIYSPDAKQTASTRPRSPGF